ncbi:hypothetical protein H6P81_019664 [Aristolochia fimbriata]|uniref:Uncharacterized protein n=1 Tax=Aristolochia fimbriata TaxID=158543 RepID=A0AAV7DT93_ARIFI|nr:hypothetical protein H6P81_019664 [Aristolochia fimbriata]
MGRGRAPCCEKIGLKKGPWTPSEDMRLMAYIQKYGHGNWRALPKQAGLLRCGKSCRLRWINYLRPDIKRGNFTPEEEETIIKLHGLLGNKWSKIASRLPGRTDNEIKNVWNTHLKKRLLSKEADPSSEETKETSSSFSSSAGSTLSSCNQSEGTIKDEGAAPAEPGFNLESPHEVSNKTEDRMEFQDSSMELIEIPFEPNLQDLWDVLEDHDQSPPSPSSELVISSSTAEQPKPKPSLSSSSSFSSTTSTSTSALNIQHAQCKEEQGEQSEVMLEIPNEANSDVWDMLDDDLGCLESSKSTVLEAQQNEATEGFGQECKRQSHEYFKQSWITDLEYELQISPQEGDHLLSVTKDIAADQAEPGFPSYDGTLDFELFDPIVAYFQNQPPSPTLFS